MSDLTSNDHTRLRAIKQRGTIHCRWDYIVKCKTLIYNDLVWHSKTTYNKTMYVITLTELGKKYLEVLDL